VPAVYNTTVDKARLLIWWIIRFTTATTYDKKCWCGYM